MTARSTHERVLRRLRRELLRWWGQHGRRYPWRETGDPYAVLLAEVLLQRTAADQVLPVYSALLTTYPRPVDLAKAERAELVGFFASTGLRKRVQTLEAIGAAIAGAWNGRIPRSQAKLRAVPGIGQYIANAVLALAWRRRVPIVDWPVARVLRRAFGRSELSPPKSDSDLWNLAAGLLPARRSKEFSLAVLDLADLVCRPSKPRCPECPWMMHCVYNRRVTEGSACRVTGSPRETIVTGTDPLDT